MVTGKRSPGCARFGANSSARGGGNTVKAALAGALPGTVAVSTRAPGPPAWKPTLGVPCP